MPKFFKFYKKNSMKYVGLNSKRIRFDFKMFYSLMKKHTFKKDNLFLTIFLYIVKMLIIKSQ